jgi:hypothetical protein
MMEAPKRRDLNKKLPNYRDPVCPVDQISATSGQVVEGCPSDAPRDPLSRLPTFAAIPSTQPATCFEESRYGSSNAMVDMPCQWGDRSILNCNESAHNLVLIPHTLKDKAIILGSYLRCSSSQKVKRKPLVSALNVRLHVL